MLLICFWKTIGHSVLSRHSNMIQFIALVLLIPQIAANGLVATTVSVIAPDWISTDPNVPQQKNQYSLEKILCFTNPHYVVNITCDARPVARNTVKAHFEAFIAKPTNDILMRFNLYYRYNTYQKFLIDRTENFCQFMRDEASPQTPMMRLFYDNIRDYTALNHTCPYNGSIVLFKADRFNFDSIKFAPLIPSGRYRLDLTFYHTNRSNYIGKAEVYLRISDHRLWH